MYYYPSVHINEELNIIDYKLSIIVDYYYCEGETANGWRQGWIILIRSTNNGFNWKYKEVHEDNISSGKHSGRKTLSGQIGSNRRTDYIKQSHPSGKGVKYTKTNDVSQAL